MATIEWPISKKCAAGDDRDELDQVVIEVPLEIRVNGMPLVRMMRLPGDEKELALGFCLTERVIPSAGAIKQIRYNREMTGLRATEENYTKSDTEEECEDVVEVEVEGLEDARMSREPFVVLTGRGGADLSLIGADMDGAIRKRIKVTRQALFGLEGKLTAFQNTYINTRGAHGAGIFTPEGKQIVVTGIFHIHIPMAIFYHPADKLTYLSHGFFLSPRRSCRPWC
jgi:FdhD protein